MNIRVGIWPWMMTIQGSFFFHQFLSSPAFNRKFKFVITHLNAPNFLQIMFMNFHSKVKRNIFAFSVFHATIYFTSQKSLVLEGTHSAICLTMWGLTPPFWALSFEKIAQIFCPPLAFATISPMPDSGHKPSAIDNNSYGVTQRHTLTALWPALSIMVYKQLVRICGGGGGGGWGLPLTKATCWMTGQGKQVILPKLGYQLPKQDIFVMNRISNFHIWRILSGV